MFGASWADMPLILASNDANASDDFDWKDITGIQYHFPHQYSGMIQPGERFLYYRGVRRRSGKRSSAEYFGQGVIGEVWRDEAIPAERPKNRWQWYCAIDEYIPWSPPLPAKIEGVLWESIPKNRWRSGVRRLPEETYHRMLASAGLHLNSSDRFPEPQLPSLNAIEPTLSDSLLRPTPPRALSPSGSESRGGRYSRRSKLIGDRAESIVEKFIRENVPQATDVQWLARAGETPGWDIQYRTSDGLLVRVEVKGTAQQSITNFELTANELLAARTHGAGYRIMLVAECFSTHPKIQIIDHAMMSSLIMEPIRWRLSLASFQHQRYGPDQPVILLGATGLASERPGI